jgi:RNA polymerase sigma-70 factor (ECF subfamily)
MTRSTSVRTQRSQVPADTSAKSKFNQITEEIYEPLQRYLLRRAPRPDAEDALSEILLTVWRRLDDVPVDHILPWCYGIARRTLANQRRGQRRALRLAERLQAEPTEHQPDPGEALGDPRLDRALRRLNDQEQEIVRLWAWEQLEPREIAIVVGISPNAAALRLSRAKKKLSQEMTRQDLGSAGHISSRGTEEHPDV